MPGGCHHGEKKRVRGNPRRREATAKNWSVVSLRVKPLFELFSAELARALVIKRLVRSLRVVITPSLHETREVMLPGALLLQASDASFLERPLGLLATSSEREPAADVNTFFMCLQMRSPFFTDVNLP